MITRKPIFPNVIELNVQAGHLIGCNVYLIYDADEWVLIDIGYEDTVDEVIDLVRDLDFPLSKCKSLIATHADVDHSQGFAKAKQILKTTVTAHPRAAELLESGDRLQTFAEINAQGIREAMPPVAVEHKVNEGSVIEVGRLQIEVWSTPGHADSQLAFRLGDLLLSGDNIYRDGGVGAIDAHHGSDIPSFIRSLERIRDCDIQWLLPSHGPYFRKDPAMINRVIDRLKGYLHLSDFGTCAIDWPLIKQWEQEIAEGRLPK
ncbi:MAG: MBL fold metallo-hydrolase [Planctomycetes bacterium]|jgi:glyoxylase-like metal-dependent hydrolase (beta-lactamase superfamily II)|nr:MBL fold metallo-hydrolase [Planctomycetota bacterium]